MSRLCRHLEYGGVARRSTRHPLEERRTKTGLADVDELW
jgi:hypothetical protein